MSVRKEIQEYSGVYFVTFTCARWLKLFEITNGYNAVYKWFDYLKSKGHEIVGYVIMPNHVHVLIAFRNTQGQSINSIVGAGKRFMAYELIKLLKERKEDEILKLLSSLVNATEKKRGKHHEVFEPSFDWKECSSERFIEQKLNYIHDNPCRGNWNLVAQSGDYIHSSAGYYIDGKEGPYSIFNFKLLQDLDLTKPQLER